jgi:translation initiation factor IF-2
MYDAAGKEMLEAGPSSAVELIGLAGVPAAGDNLNGLKSDDDAKRIIEHRKLQEREGRFARQKPSSIEDLFAKIQEGEKAELKVVIKSDVHGSLEAVSSSLERLSTEKVSLSVIHGSVGAITESDVMLAEASQAIIIGFNVRPDNKARKTAENIGVSITIYRVIYDLIEGIKKLMEGLLEPTYEEEYLGRAEVRDVFSISKTGAIAGSSIIDGKVSRGCRIRVLRDGTIIYEGKMASLRRFKEDAKEVTQGYECGIAVENFNDIKVGDVLEAFQMKEIAGKL